MTKIVVMRDLAQPIMVLMRNLPRTEQERVRTYATINRQRQYVLGRLAARHAIRLALSDRSGKVSIKLIPGLKGEPLVVVNGSCEIASVSISHADSLAAACAWPTQSGNGYAAGVDLERIRPTHVAHSPYAFSLRERMLIAHAPEGQDLVGLAGWVVKEAVWKALQPETSCGPEALEIQEIDLSVGHASVNLGDRLSEQLEDSNLSIQIRTIEGPDGDYLLALAEILPRSDLNRGKTVQIVWSQDHQALFC